MYSQKYLHLFIVMLCSGKSKPLDTKLLRGTCDQLGALQQHGLNYEGKHLRVELGPMLADSPAKAFIKHIKERDGNL